MTKITKRGLPDRRYQKQGPRPHRWITGTDPQLHTLYNKWLKARVQARYWCQEWRLDWEDYRDFFLAHPYEGNRRSADAPNLCRKDKQGPWSKDNCCIMSRRSQMTRAKSKDPQGRIIDRRRRNPELDRKWRRKPQGDTQ